MDSIGVIYDSGIINTITKFVSNKLNDDNIRVAFPNALLREDVLELLDRYCTVVYYPLYNESNNGFHINLPQSDGDKCHFVFINTAQTMEKQVFTAAHELGHIWKVDDYVASECDIEMDDEIREKVINRFAAELLIPRQEFIEFLLSATADLGIDSGRITVSSVLRLIARMMNFFFVPMKSIVLRLLEFNIIDKNGAALLLGKGEIPCENIQNELEQIIREQGYTKLLKNTEKKWIEGLAEMLDVVDEKGIFPSEKIENIRATFELRRKVDDSKFENTVGLTVQKDDGFCDEDK